MASENDPAEISAEATDTVLRLLWRAQLGEERGRRGPRKKLSIDEIVDAAIELADAEGLASFSMRKVAQRVGLSVMALYTYVPDRSGLIGLMIDQAIGRAPMPPHAGTLRDRLRRISRVLWEEYHRHPWLLDARSHRPWIGPHLSVRYEWELQAIEGSGLDDVSMDHTVALIETHTAANAANSIDARRLAQTSGVTDVEWWSVNAPILEQVMAPGVFPLSGRVGSAVGEAYQAVTNHEAVYEFGLDVILDGVEARLARQRRSSERG